MSDEHKPNTATASGKPPLHGLLAEYKDPWTLVEASRKVRDAGFRRWDTFTPFPVHGIEKAMGIKMTILPWIALVGGLTGLAVATIFQYWTNGVDYPWIVSGKPFWSLPANVPIMFEMTVLFAGFSTVVGMLMLNGLPHPSHPLDLKERFARATDDRFFLLIQASDPKFDERKTRELLDATAPLVLDEVLEDRTTSGEVPRLFVYGMIILTAAAAVPLAWAAKARFTKTRDPRFHLMGDMDWQPKYKAQRQNPFFADTRAQREDVSGTVAVGELREDDHFYGGRTGPNYAATFPAQIPLTEATIQRGQERFGIYCAPCHGLQGDGDGMIAKRAENLAATGEGKGMAWVPPTNLNQDYLRAQPVGQLFDTITRGIRNMPPYASQISVEDRWAIVLYLRALQRKTQGAQ